MSTDPQTPLAKARASGELVDHPSVTTLRAQLRAEGIRLVVKTGRLWRVMGWMLALLRIMPAERFLRDYWTTIGPVIAMPAEVATRPVGSAVRSLIAHESVHVSQFRWCGLHLPWIGPWLGILPMAAIYLLLPIPVGFAVGRWLLEAPAYLAGMRIQVAAGYPRQWVITRATDQLTGPSYGWAMAFWPGAVRWLFERRL